MNNSLIVLLGIMFFCLPASSMASDYLQFQKDSVAAYGFYKKSLSLTSKEGTQKKSIATVEKFIKNWKIVVSKYTQDIPQPFVNLPDYEELIKRPVSTGQQALKELRTGDISKAHSTLENVRYLLWKMRTDAGLATLSDKVNDFHEVMEIVLNMMHNEESASNYRNVGKRYGAWMEIKWEEQANANVFETDRSAFENALKDGRKAVIELLTKLENGDIKAANEAGGKVKKAYKSIFFLDSTT